MPKQELRLSDLAALGDDMGVGDIWSDAASTAQDLKKLTERAKFLSETATPRFYSSRVPLAATFAGITTDLLTDIDHLLYFVPTEQRAQLRHALIRALAQIERVTGEQPEPYRERQQPCSRPHAENHTDPQGEPDEVNYFPS